MSAFDCYSRVQKDQKTSVCVSRYTSTNKDNKVVLSIFSRSDVVISVIGSDISFFLSFLYDGCRMMFRPSFITGEMLSFALLIGKNDVFSW